MSSHLRDGALALATGGVLVAILAASGRLGVLGDPRAVGVGLTAGLVVEGLFLAETPLARWWQRPGVPTASAVVLVVAGVGLALWVGPVVIAAACWGLVVYFAALALVVAGRWSTGQ